MKLGKALKFMEGGRDTYNLTKRGMFYMHLLQNAFALNYINEVWGAMTKEPAPPHCKILNFNNSTHFHRST